MVLASVLALAAVLRFGGLGWGLRHQPHIDERYFVDNVGWMLAHRDLDHRFDEYPGLVFYVLAPVLAWFGPPQFGADAYLAARAVVAVFGVASVGLVYLLGVRLAGPATGLAAALILAVSPVEVQTAHMVRPDVVLEAFVLIALLGLTRVGTRLRDDMVAGASMGAAAAVKFTGVLLVPSYLARRLTVPGPRRWGVLAAGAAAMLVFAVCSPRTILDLDGGLAGLATQIGYHYDVRPRGAQSVAGMALTYGRVLLKAVGVVALALAVAGVWLARRDWRRWLPLWLLPLTIVAVFSTAEVHHDRFVVPALGVIALCAGDAARSPGRAVGLGDRRGRRPGAAHGVRRLRERRAPAVHARPGRGLDQRERAGRGVDRHDAPGPRRAPRPLPRAADRGPRPQARAAAGRARRGGRGPAHRGRGGAGRPAHRHRHRAAESAHRPAPRRRGAACGRRATSPSTCDRPS